MFWLENIFFPNFFDFTNWQEGELRFFQGRHISLREKDGVSKIYLNYLGPSALLPMYSTILRVALDGFKAYTKEELSDEVGFNYVVRQERLNFFMQEIQRLPAINLEQFEKTKISVMFMTLLDIINDAANEIGDAETRFKGLEDGLERYKKAVSGCSEILKNNLWGEKLPI